VKVAAFLLKQISSNATLVQKTSWCQDALFLAQLVCKGSGSQPEIPAGSQKSEVFKLLTFFKRPDLSTISCQKAQRNSLVAAVTRKQLLYCLRFVARS